MNWVFLPITKRWVSIDHIASIASTPNKDGSYDVYSKTMELHETCREDAEAILSRISEISRTYIFMRTL